jgi:hypothetical protein
MWALLVPAAVVVWLIVSGAHVPRRVLASPTIRDVPCGTCCEGYGRFHECDSEAYCPCNQPMLHTTLAGVIDRLERECEVGPYARP